MSLAAAAGSMMHESTVKDRYIDSLADSKVSMMVASHRQQPLRQMMTHAVDMKAAFKRREAMDKPRQNPNRVFCPACTWHHHKGE